MASNFLKLIRALAGVSVVCSSGAALANTSVTNTAGATIRIDPYSVTANYDKSSSAAVQANGIAGYSLSSTLSSLNYVNPLDALAGYTGLTGNSNTLGTSNLASQSTTCGASTCSVLRSTTSSLMSVANGNAQLADLYAVTDPSGTFSLDISSKNADKFTRNNQLSAPTGLSIGVDVSAASSYSVTQQGVAGMSASVLSPTKVSLNTDAAGAGSRGQITLTGKSLSNGVQETYSTTGSVSVDGATAYLKANTTNHIAINAVNAQIGGTQELRNTSGAVIGTFSNTDIVATTAAVNYLNADGDMVRDQKAVLASGSYTTKSASQGATSIKISNDPADELRVFKRGAADVYSTGFAKQETTTSCTRQTVNRRIVCSSDTTSVTEAAPSVVPSTGVINLPDYSTQQLTASGVTWVDASGSSASGATRPNNVRVSNVNINSAAGGSGAGANTMTAGGFGNTVSMQTTFDMTVFGR